MFAKTTGNLHKFRLQNLYNIFKRTEKRNRMITYRRGVGVCIHKWAHSSTCEQCSQHHDVNHSTGAIKTKTYSLGHAQASAVSISSVSNSSVSIMQCQHLIPSRSIATVWLLLDFTSQNCRRLLQGYYYIFETFSLIGFTN